jgi:hypothetical protein
MEQLYHQGFKGKIISCTLDYYDEIIAKTNKDFVDGTIFQFPDFDDPMLEQPGVNFPNPGDFDARFRQAHPNDWSAVSWEYPAILLNWIEGAKAAGSVEPTAVLEALKSNSQPEFIYGEGTGQRRGRPLAGGRGRGRQGTHQGVSQRVGLARQAYRRADQAHEGSRPENRLGPNARREWPATAFPASVRRARPGNLQVSGSISWNSLSSRSSTA